MNKRAAATELSGLPLWHMASDASLFCGVLGVHDVHTHSVPVLIAGLYESFHIRVSGRESCSRAAVVPAGTGYGFDGHGMPVSVIYLEPKSGGVADLRALLDQSEQDGQLTSGEFKASPLFRDLFEAPGTSCDVREALLDVLDFGARLGGGGLDLRLASVIDAMSEPLTGPPLTLGEAARGVGLSPSRFQHVFTREVGIPFRRYRLWQRLKAAISEIADGETFTSAAHGAGFADLAHFSRAYRSTFGAAPSLTLSHRRR